MEEEKIVSMHLRFLKSKRDKLKAKKDASGCKTWEDWVVKISGIEEDE